MEEFITACPRNCYSTCSFRVQVENKKIRRILPYSGNLSTPSGPCIKGLSYLERTYSPDRIIFPLKKDSDGKFKRISTTDALDIITEKLSSLKNRFGPASILWLKGSGMSGLTNDIGNNFWKVFGGPTITYGNLCWPAGLEAVRLTLGSVKHNVPWDIENARTVLIWGKNPAETNIQEIAFIATAKERGARIIVIDPFRTLTADKADILYSPKPGTDAALALAISYVLIENDLIDRIFIEENVRGFNEFRNSLKTSPADAEIITGIPAEEIVSLARLIASEGPVTILPGYGLQRHANGGQTIRSILAIAILTGNLGKRGAGFNYANLQSYVFDDMKEPLSYYPDPERDRPFRRIISMAKLGSDMLNTSDPALKGCWIERGNPVLQAPDTINFVKALSGLDFKVVVEQFMTDTAELADIILPAKDMFEQSDILGSYWSPYVLFKPKVIDSPGEVMPETEIYFHLAQKMNMKLSKELVPEPGNINTEEWLENRIKGFSDLSLADLKTGPVLAPGLQQIAYEDMKFDTPSGKIELFSAEAHAKWGVAPLPDFNSPDIQGEMDQYPLVLLTPNTGSRIHSQFGNLKIITESVQKLSVLISPEDAAKRLINSGDMLRIFNHKGEIRTRSEISNRVSQGTIIMPNGIWLSEGGGGNNLIEGRETDMGYGAAFHDNRVEIEKSE
jgi:anaerobic selenocysteine-containing dehydrogenase